MVLYTNFFGHFFFLKFSSSSPTYQLSTKSKNLKNKLTLKEAPLVDPEPTSDISNFNVSSVVNNNGNAPISENEPNSAGLRTDPGKSNYYSSIHSKNQNQKMRSVSKIKVKMKLLHPRRFTTTIRTTGRDRGWRKFTKQFTIVAWKASRCTANIQRSTNNSVCFIGRR